MSVRQILSAPLLCVGLVTAGAALACAVSDIAIKSTKARFFNACTRSACFQMKGIAVLVNNCAEPIGVRVKITGYDKFGTPMATRELWPASIENIPPGEFTFSLDNYLDYEQGMTAFKIEPTSVKRWRN